MITSENLEYHVEFASASFITILVFCLCGIVLNATMLVFFFKKKLVFTSVYSAYMIQIVITDLIVCLIWIVMLSMILHNMPSYSDLHEIFKPDGLAALFESFQEKVENDDRNFEIYRIVFATYNMHYYINIFLLAAMSIERCIAVKKSLQCQRYVFKKNVICGVSLLMWLTALACTLPSFISPDFITHNEQTDILLGKANENDQFRATYAESSKELIACYKPLQVAQASNHNYVTDQDNVSLEKCVDFMADFVYHHEKLKQKLADNATGLKNSPNRTIEHYNVKRDTLPRDNILFQLPRYTYEVIFHTSLKVMIELYNNSYYDNIDQICDPYLDKDAKIYQITTNLVIGFFLPCVIIIYTNLFIAYHIWKPAKQRLIHSRKIICSAKCLTSQSKNGNQTDRESYYSRNCAPIELKQMKNDKNKESDDFEEQNTLQNEETERLLQDLRKIRSCQHEDSCVGNRIRSTSFNGKVQQYRISSSSVESFPTDLTTMVTCSSPGLSQSMPPFSFVDDTDSQTSCSTASSKRGSMRFHSVIPQIGVSTSPLHDSAIEQRLVENQHLLGVQNRLIIPSNRSILMKNDLKPKLQDDRKGESRDRSNRDVKLAALALSNRQRINNKSSANGDKNVKAKRKKDATLRVQISEIERGPGFSGDLNEGSTATHKSKRSSKKKVTLLQNATRQINLSRVIFIYVIVFACCWMPFKVVTVFYYVEEFIGRTDEFCHRIWSVTRIISFISVLLNPIVYAATQKFASERLRACFRKLLLTFRRNDVRTDQHENCTCVAKRQSNGQNRKKEQHLLHKEKWSKIAVKLGSKNPRYSFSTSYHNKSQKLSDGTIDEEKESQRSNGHSSTT